MVWFGRCSEPEESNVDLCCALGMFQGNQQRLQEGEGGAWSAGGSPEGGSCAGFIPTPSAWHHPTRHPQVTRHRNTSGALQGCQPEPWAVPRELGAGCWHCVPLGPAVPSRLSARFLPLPVFCQRLSGLWLRCCTGSTQVSCPLPATQRNSSWAFCNQPQSRLLHCR